LAPIPFLPSILWIALAFWIATLVGSSGYLIYRRWRHSGSRIKIDGDSFLFKTFLVAASFVSIFSIGTGVQFLNPNAGIDQFLVIFVLVMWLKYSVTDLKQRLESFVVAKAAEKTDEREVDPIAIAREFVRGRLPHVTITGFFDETTSIDDRGRSKVEGIAGSSTYPLIHEYHVIIAENGQILYDESYVKQ
jgi:hypothetical protein